MGLKKEIRKYLKENVSPRRYKHILGVRKTAVILGNLYFKDSSYKSKGKFIEDLSLAALLHDIDKGKDDQTLYKKIVKSKYYSKKFIKEMQGYTSLYHALSGAIRAKEEFKIENKNILDSITWHTTGKKNMTTFEKIIYLSDYIEPQRTMEGVDKIRKVALNNLDKACFMATEDTIFYLKKNKMKINKYTIDFYKNLKGQVK